MYIIMVYDIAENRVNKVLKTARKYLTWIQNSVLEGEITPAKYQRLKHELEQIIDKNHDSIKFYILRDQKQLKTETLGQEKGTQDNII